MNHSNSNAIVATTNDALVATQTPTNQQSTEPEIDLLSFPEHPQYEYVAIVPANPAAPAPTVRVTEFSNALESPFVTPEKPSSSTSTVATVSSASTASSSSSAKSDKKNSSKKMSDSKKKEKKPALDPKVARHKENRKAAQAGAAVAGAVVGAVVLGPIGMALGGVAAHRTAKVVGRRNEKKLQQKVDQATYQKNLIAGRGVAVV